MRAQTRYKILIYDTSCMPLRAQVDVDLFEDGGCEYLDYGHTGPLKGENTFGVQLTLPAVPRSITVIVTDEEMKYSGNCYLNLNGTVSSRLDLILWQLPSDGYGFGGGGFGGPPDQPRGPKSYRVFPETRQQDERRGTYRAFLKTRQQSEAFKRPDPQNAIGDIYERIHQQPSWSREQRKAVETLVSNYMSFVIPNLATADNHPPRFLRIRDLWSNKLLRLGISVSSLEKTKQKVAHLQPAEAATNEKVF